MLAGMIYHWIVLLAKGKQCSVADNHEYLPPQNLAHLALLEVPYYHSHSLGERGGGGRGGRRMEGRMEGKGNEVCFALPPSLPPNLKRRCHQLPIIAYRHPSPGISS